MKKLPVFLISLSLLLLSACRAEWLTADSLPWVGEGPVLFQDDFSKETGGWSTHEDTVSFSGYEQSGFRLSSDVPDYQFWSVPGLNFSDSLVYVKARKISGPENNLFGVVCRFQDSENFYALMIGSDGYYGIFKRVDGEQSLVDQRHMDFSEAIQTGDGINDIKAICQGDYLALFVNETRLIQVRDDSLGYGDVGMIVGNLKETGVNILFDDFVVLKP
jgi:hypothetical protein